MDNYERRMLRAESAGYTTGLIVLFVAWLWCTWTYGFLLGFGLGWLPSGILAFIVGVVVRSFAER